jgi:hypothetical protein
MADRSTKSLATSSGFSATLSRARYEGRKYRPGYIPLRTTLRVDFEEIERRAALYVDPLNQPFQSETNSTTLMERSPSPASHSPSTLDAPQTQLLPLNGLLTTSSPYGTHQGDASPHALRKSALLLDNLGSQSQGRNSVSPQRMKDPSVSSTQWSEADSMVSLRTVRDPNALEQAAIAAKKRLQEALSLNATLQHYESALRHHHRTKKSASPRASRRKAEPGLGLDAAAEQKGLIEGEAATRLVIGRTETNDRQAVMEWFTEGRKLLVSRAPEPANAKPPLSATTSQNTALGERDRSTTTVALSSATTRRLSAFVVNETTTRRSMQEDERLLRERLVSDESVELVLLKTNEQQRAPPPEKRAAPEVAKERKDSKQPAADEAQNEQLVIAPDQVAIADDLASATASPASQDLNGESGSRNSNPPQEERTPSKAELSVNPVTGTKGADLARVLSSLRDASPHKYSGRFRIPGSRRPNEGSTPNATTNGTLTPDSLPSTAIETLDFFDDILSLFAEAERSHAGGPLPLPEHLALEDAKNDPLTWYQARIIDAVIHVALVQYTAESMMSFPFSPFLELQQLSEAGAEEVEPGGGRSPSPSRHGGYLPSHDSDVI